MVYPPAAIQQVVAQVGVQERQNDVRRTIVEPPPAPPIIHHSVPIVINPRPQPIPTLIHRPPYYIYPRPVPQTSVAFAGRGYLGPPPMVGVQRLPFVSRPGMAPQLFPARRILASRRSVSHGQSGIEQIGTGNNILQGNVQQIQLGSKKSKRRGLLCQDCFKLNPGQSSIFGSKGNFARIE